ncbi:MULTISPECIES: hypothetical protein [unclassified Streptomyces]|nr:hypothetical protein [Streptomyces sp. NBC_00047]MCX5606537.1 hypothetical protein [Streptomyces sp. NBC_00047]
MDDNGVEITAGGPNAGLDPRRLAHALDASLNIALGDDHEQVVFVARTAA